MEKVDLLLNQIGIFAVMLVVGFLARKINLAGKKVFDSLATFTVNILLPLFMLTTLPSVKGSALGGKVALFLITFCVFYFVMYALSIISNNIFRMEDEPATINMVVITTTCAGFVGLPIASAMYGAYGSLIMALYSAFDNFTMWTHKSYALNKFNPNIDVRFWNRLINPQIICILAGIFLALMPIELNGNFIWDSLTNIGDMAKYMGMLFLGSTLCDLNKDSLKYIKPISYMIIIRMIIFPIIFGLGLSKIQLYSADDIFLLILILATPPMSSVPTIIKSYGLDERYAAQSLILTTLVSLFTIPMVLWLVFKYAA